MKAGNLTGIGNHNQRKTQNHSNKEIDVERSHLNYDLVAGRTENYTTDIQKFIEENNASNRAVRKDAVLVNEWIISSDQAFFENKDDKEIERFFEVAKNYFADKVGDKNIRYAQVHLDETTPHMHLGIVPFDENNKLSAKRVFNRAALLQVQDELPKAMKELGFDIQRGEQGSERKNLTVPEFKEMTKELEEVKVELSEKKDEIIHLTNERPKKLNSKALEIMYEMKDVEVPTGEKNIFGVEKTKTEKQRTGNVVMPLENFKVLEKQVIQNERFQRQVDKYLSTDLVKRNQELEDELGRVKRINNENVEIYYNLEKKYNKVVSENDSLKNKVHLLKNEIKTIYRAVKDTFKQIFGSQSKSKEVTKEFAMQIEQKAPDSEFRRLERNDNRTRSRGLSR